MVIVFPGVRISSSRLFFSRLGDYKAVGIGSYEFASESLRMIHTSQFYFSFYSIAVSIYVSFVYDLTDVV